LRCACLAVSSTEPLPRGVEAGGGLRQHRRRVPVLGHGDGYVGGLPCRPAAGTGGCACRGGGSTRRHLHERREPGVTRPGSLLPWSAAYGRGPWSGGCQRRAALRSFAVPPHHQRRALPAAHRARCEHRRRRHAAAEGWFEQRHRLVSSSLPRLRPMLPLVQGELMADCVQREGAWSCLSATSGDWQQCDMGAPQAIVSDQGQLLVAQVSSIPPLTSQAATLLKPISCWPAKVSKPAHAGAPAAAQHHQRRPLPPAGRVPRPPVLRLRGLWRPPDRHRRNLPHAGKLPCSFARQARCALLHDPGGLPAH
jgi:hypothetical protein